MNRLQRVSNFISTFLQELFKLVESLTYEEFLLSNLISMKNHEDPADISRIIKQPTFLLCGLKETVDVSHCDNLVKYKILLEINNNNLSKIPLGAGSIFLIFPIGYWD
jgi:hypothetical protein